jgi:hypothetical protein
VLVFYYLEEHTSERHLLHVLEEDNFAREVIAPPEGIKKSSHFGVHKFPITLAVNLRISGTAGKGG